MPTVIPENRPGAPTEATEVAESTPVAPAELTEVADNQVPVPVELTEVANNQVPIPPELTEVAQLTPVAPAELTEVADNQVPVPVELTEVAQLTPVAPAQIDNDPVTNLLLQSGDLSQAEWIKTNADVPSSEGSGLPFNLLDPTKLIRVQAASTGVIAPLVSQAVTVVSGRQYTLSFYARPSQLRYLQVNFGTGDIVAAGEPRVNFDLASDSQSVDTVDSGLTATISNAIEDVLGNQVCRCSVTFTANTTALDINFQLILTTTTARLATESHTLNNGLYITGVQLVEGSAARGYVETTGVTVTEGEVPPPAELTEVAESSPVAPVELTEVAQLTPVAPVELTEVALAPLPRTIEAILKLDFANQAYSINGNADDLTDLVTYSRADSATFWNRRINNRGEYETFIDTDFVGTVTNLLTYSEDFTDPDWGKNRSSVEFSQQENAFKFIEDGTASDTHNMGQIVSWTSGNTYTLSAKVKAGSGRRAYLYLPPAAFPSQAVALFDLEAGQIVNDGAMGDGAKDFSIAYEGDGFYRISVTGVCDTTTSSSCNLFLADGNATTYDGDSESFIYVTEFQLTVSDKIRPYVQTLGASDSNTFTASPRIAYDPLTAQPLGLLCEGLSTNLIPTSEDFSTNWSDSVDIIINDAKLKAPDGTYSAFTIEEDETTSTHFTSINITVTDGDNVTASVYMKRGTADYAILRSNNDGIDTYVVLDTSDFSITETGSNVDRSRVTPCQNGWYRVQMSWQSSGDTSSGMVIAFSNSATPGDSLPSYAVGAGEGKTLVVWGAQFEIQQNATSYIYTNGASDSRAVDDFSGELNLYGRGSMAIKVRNDDDIPVPSANYNLLELSADNINRIAMIIDDGNEAYFFTNRNGTTEGFIQSGSYLINQASGPVDFVVTFEPTNAAAYHNGDLIGTDVTINPVDTTDFSIGKAVTGSERGFCYIQSIEIYDKVLTANEVSAR